MAKKPVTLDTLTLTLQGESYEITEPTLRVTCDAQHKMERAAKAGGGLLGMLAYVLHVCQQNPRFRGDYKELGDLLDLPGKSAMAELAAFAEQLGVQVADDDEFQPADVPAD